MNKMNFTYNTICKPATAQFKDRGSRFLGFSFPVADTDAVKEQLRQLKQAHPKANHHCFAYRLGTEGNDFRANDHGEPSGSAGKPILGQIDRLQVTDTLVVVVRYFGGTLLGIPGLIHAYKTTAALCLEAAGTVEKNIEQKANLSFNYPVFNEVLQVCRNFDATIYRQELALFCSLSVGIPVKVHAACLQRLSEISGLEVVS